MSFPFAYQIRWAWSLTKGYRWGLLLYFTLEVFAIALSLLFIFYSKRAIDQAVHAVPGSIRTTLALVVGSVLLGIIVKIFSTKYSETIKLRMGIDLQYQLISGQMRAVWKFMKDWHTGDLMVRIQTDSAEVVQMLSQTFLSLLLVLIRLGASFGFLWLMDPMLALVIVAISPLFLFSKLYFRKMRRISKEVKEAESNFGHVMQENLRLRLLTRALGLIPAREKTLQVAQADIYRLKMDQQNFSIGSQTMMKFTVNGGYLLTFIWGVYRLDAGQISFGTMAAFLQLVGRIQTPIMQTMAFVPSFVRFRTAVDRVLELFADEKEVFTKQANLHKVETLSFDDVSFRYKDNTVIDALHVKLYAGEPTAIVGSSGRGKTTLIRLLLALISPQNGAIRLHVEGRTEILSTKHRTNFAYVPQGNSLFSGTIRDNLLLANEEAEDSRLEHAIYLACAEFVFALPQGLDTVVGESGFGLSEGQAQRIAIARAMMRDAPIWLLDEITSALDSETADELVGRLVAAGKDKIILFVTHDLRLAEKCHQIVYMQA